MNKCVNISSLRELQRYTQPHKFNYFYRHTHTHIQNYCQLTMKSSILRLASYLVNYATSVPVCNQELFLELELPDVTEFGSFLYIPLSKSQLRDLLSMYFMLIFFRLLSDRSSDSPGHFKIHGRAYSHSTAFFQLNRGLERCVYH